MRGYTLSIFILLSSLCNGYAQFHDLSDAEVQAHIQPPIDTLDIAAALELSARSDIADQVTAAQKWLRTADSLMRVSGDETLRYRYLRREGLHQEFNLGNVDSALFYWKAALKAASQTGIRQFEITVLRTLTIFHFEQENDSLALSYAHQAEKIARDAGAYASLFDIIVVRAVFLRMHGNEEDAEQTIQSFKATIPSLPSPVLRARAMTEIGNYYWNHNDLPHVLMYYLKAQEYLTDVKDTLENFLNRSVIASVHDELGDFGKAVESSRDAISWVDGRTDLEDYPNELNSLGWFLYHHGEMEEAIQVLRKSLTTYRKHFPDRTQIAYPLGNLGLVMTKNEQYDSAIYYSQKAATIFDSIGFTSGVAEAQNNIGKAYLGKGELIKAKDFLNSGLQLSQEAQDGYEERNAHNGLYLLSKQLGKTEDALFHLERYHLLNDSIYNMDKLSQAQQVESVLAEQRDAAIIQSLEAQSALDQERIRQQRILGISGIVVFFVILASFIQVYRNWKARKKAYFKLELKHKELEASNQLINAQKSEIEEQKTMIEEQHKDMVESINFASRIQHALLKPEDHVDEAIPEHLVLYKPRDIVSGDFYWASHHGDYLFIAAVDCTGHGVPGAMMSMLGMSYLNEIVGIGNHHIEPKEILTELRSKVIKELQQDKATETHYHEGMDMALVRLNLKTNELLFSGANNPLWLYRKGEIIQIRGNKQGISYSAQMEPFEQHQIQLQTEDTFYIFSDGYADQFGGPRGKKFKYSTFRELLLSIQDLPLERQKDVLSERFESWKGELDQIDDVCVIGLRV